MLIGAGVGAKEGASAGIAAGRNIVMEPNRMRQQQWEEQGKGLDAISKMAEARRAKNLAGLQFAYGEAGKDVDRTERAADRTTDNTRADNQLEETQIANEQRAMKDDRTQAETARYHSGILSSRDREMAMRANLAKDRTSNNPLDEQRIGKNRDVVESRVISEVANDPRYAHLFETDDKGGIVGFKQQMDKPGRLWGTNKESPNAEDIALMKEAQQEIQKRTDQYVKSGKKPGRSFLLPKSPILGNMDDNEYDPGAESGGW